MKRFWAILFTVLFSAGFLTGACAQTTAEILQQARMYDSAFDTKVRLLIPQGAEVELVEIGEERVLVRYGSFCGWIEREAIGEEAAAAFPTATPEPTQTPMVMVTPSPAQEEIVLTDSTQEPESAQEDLQTQQETLAPAKQETASATPEPTQTPQPTPTPEPTIPPLRMNSSGQRVEELQQNLAELGYNIGKVDGYYGKKTRNAVIKLQRTYGLYADGIAGEETLGLIETLLGPEADSVETAPLPFVRVLRKGKTGAEVENLQKALCELGYLTEEQVTATFDAQTQSAVETFQKEAGLEADGVAGEKTIFVLSSTLQAYRNVQRLNNQ